MNERTDAVHARVEPELKQAFNRAAVALDRSLSQLLRDLIREYVHRYQRGELWDPGLEAKRRLLDECAAGGER